MNNNNNKINISNIKSIIAIISIIGISIIHGCTEEESTTSSNNTIEIRGTLSYNNITVEEGRITNLNMVSPRWTDEVAGQTVMYEISKRPAGVNKSNITIDFTNGVITVASNAVVNDSGEYTVIVTGTGSYEGSVVATITISIKKRIGGSFSYDDISVIEGNVSNISPVWVTNSEEAGQMVEYEISARPSLANAGNVSIDLSTGEISVATTATTNDTGEYEITATGTGIYGGSIVSNIQIIVRRGIGGILSYNDINLIEGNVSNISPVWVTNSEEARQTVEYAIVDRPARANAGSVSIDSSTGEISVATTATTNDTGQYEITATGTENYGGSIPYTVQINIRRAITGSLSYVGINVRMRDVSNVSPNWLNEEAGQTVRYEISRRPATANMGGITIDSNTGIISATTNTVLNDGGEYEIRATGIGNYEDSITGTIQVTIRKRLIIGELSYGDINLVVGNAGSRMPDWTGDEAGQTVEYAISRPPGVNAGSVTIDTTTGVVSVTNNAITNDSGEYEITATGIGNYEGSIVSNIQISIRHTNWFRLTSTAQFPARSFHSAVVLNGDIYVMGGQLSSSGTPTNDVWKSSDAGTNWMLVANGQFPVRSAHSSVVLNGEIYVIGGTGAGGGRDVWKSDNAGTNWVRITDNAEFISRGHHSSVVLDGRIYVIGGLHSTRRNDVWESSNGGTNWTEVTTSTSTRFPGRLDHTSVVLNDDIYVIAGFGDLGRLDDIQKSIDRGVNWAEVSTSTATPFSARQNHTSVVLNNEMYVMGGNDLRGEKNDVWKSSDGINWDQITTAITEFPIRHRHASVVLDGNIYVIGGENGTLYNDVWVYR